MLKKLIIKSLVVILSCSLILSLTQSVQGASIEDTGHLSFSCFYVPETTSLKLINSMSDDDIKTYLKQVKRKAFGYSVAPAFNDVEVSFDGDVVFAKSNNTTETLTFTYTYQVAETVETSVSVMGTISGKASGKVKSATLGLDAAIRGEIGYKTKTVVTETTRTNFNINPGRKLSLIVKGKARVNNGASKYYFFWVSLKSGMWEYIDVVSEYYEFYEENL